MQTREHHGAIYRKYDGTAWLLNDEAPQKGKPAQTPVERQQMRLADEQRKSDMMVSMQSRRSTAQGRARIPPALGLRVGFDAPNAPDLHWHTVQTPFTGYNPHVSDELSLHRPDQDTPR
jgi:hypothetical protein